MKITWSESRLLDYANGKNDTYEQKERKKQQENILSPKKAGEYGRAGRI